MILRHLRVNTIMLPGRETTYLRIPGKAGLNGNRHEATKFGREGREFRTFHPSMLYGLLRKVLPDPEEL